MNLKSISLVIASSALIAGTAFAFGTTGCSGECISCHAIKKEEFVKIFKTIDPQAKVIDVKLSPVKGLYELTMETPKNKGIVYMDFGKKHIVSGNIIDISSKTNLTSSRIEQVAAKTIQISRIPVKDAIILGNPKGKKTIYVFTDPDCPFCQKLHPELKSLIREDKNLRVALILSPLPIHPDAKWKSQAIISKSHGDMPGAIILLEDSYTNKPLARPQDSTLAMVAGNLKASKDLGIKLLPSIVLPNGKVFEGFKPKAEIKTLLSQS